ncbi:hypothetical protein Tsubulata_018908 [Turnera subulata]|uniref:DUF4283 domain-containing protein n=1 Tax=Turnera subulata TaxID=218843 RepID=A0A9Q0FN27_9ROSI|nr:hypothetical protein Tsubulata_018908 [Turnera subulata]
MNTMKQVWRPVDGIEVSQVDCNLVVFQFYHWCDRQRMLDQEPWNFDDQVVLLKEPTGTEQPSSMQLFHAPFWVRVYDVPYNFRTESVVRVVAGKIRSFMGLEENCQLQCGKYISFRLSFDVRRPLVRDSFLVGMGGPPGASAEAEKEKLVDMPYGDWLQASPKKAPNLIPQRDTAPSMARKLVFKPYILASDGAASDEHGISSVLVESSRQPPTAKELRTVTQDGLKLRVDSSPQVPIPKLSDQEDVVARVGTIRSSIGPKPRKALILYNGGSSDQSQVHETQPPILTVQNQGSPGRGHRDPPQVGITPVLSFSEGLPFVFNPRVQESSTEMKGINKKVSTIKSRKSTFLPCPIEVHKVLPEPPQETSVVEPNDLTVQSQDLMTVK